MRVFVALPLPVAWVDAIRVAQGELRAQLDPKQEHPGKWLAPGPLRAKWVAPHAAPHALHLTLAFLGEIDEALVEPLAKRLEALAGETPAFDWRIVGPLSFQGGGRAHRRGARVLGCEVDGGETLRLLASRIGQGCDEVAPGARDPKPFRPHVTVARCDPPWPAPAVALFEAAFTGLPSAPTRAVEAVLVRSELRPAGAVHTVLRHLPLSDIAG